jgi:hypothetical protein
MNTDQKTSESNSKRKVANLLTSDLLPPLENTDDGIEYNSKLLQLRT